MNKSPLNYILTIASAALLWVISAIFIGASYSESLMLAELTPEEFQSVYIIILAISASFGLINCLYWYYYGNKESTAGKLSQAKRVWWSSFFVQIVASVLLFFAIVFVNINEGIQVGQWLIIFLFISLHTWIFFWFFSFIISPRAVKYIPLFR